MERPGAEPGRLPRTGAPVTSFALDGLTLVGGGLLLLRYRRRMVADL
jgi:LPXTG-motif cell wall-anchored protein